MTPLRRLIADEIGACGPMTLARYMDLCLLHPDHGYYATRDPFGAAGDFTTAPEISQMFGELIGLWLAQTWLDQGRPAPFTLAELGPGRGTLMADARRAMAVVPGLAEASQIHLIEASAHLRKAQTSKLGAVRHTDAAADLPQAPLFLIANEFFDALPIHQFQRGPNGWSERLIGLQGDLLVFGLGPPLRISAPGEQGEIIESCPSALPIITEIASRIAEFGGAALIVDYGGWNGRGDTFQSVKSHLPVDPFAGPGTADLTAHVDFARLAAVAQAQGCHTGYTTQGQFLTELGIAMRASKLEQAGDSGATSAAHRLTDPGQMGSLFKALAIWPKTAPPPAGFARLAQITDQPDTPT